VNSRHATAVAILLVIGAKSLAAEGNPARGQHVFGACAACHSLQPDQNMTGPRLRCMSPKRTAPKIGGALK